MHQKKKRPVVGLLCFYRLRLVGQVEILRVKDEGAVVYFLGFGFIFCFLEAYRKVAEKFTDILVDHGLQVFGGQFAEVDHDAFLSVRGAFPVSMLVIIRSMP